MKFLSGKYMLLLAMFNLEMYTEAASMAKDTFNWDLLKPSSDLEWTTCYTKFTCAKLEVPLDYADHNVGTTGIAFIKYTPPGNTENSENIVLNFGGPGGAGVDTLAGFDPVVLSNLLGRHHNIVSFDPRGVGHSGPKVDCFGDDLEARESFYEAFYGQTTNASSAALATQFYSSAIFGDWCSHTISQNNSKAVYISTPAVAEDMLAYAAAEQKAAGKQVAAPQLWYYGVSYGTALGTTFASLFPDNVGRIVLDGVIDAEDYYKNGWMENLYQADQALESFATFCHQAGPKNCSFWGSSPRNILTRLDNVLDNLKNNPIPMASFGNSGSNTTGLATYSDLKTLILQALYSPISDFVTLSELLTGIENGIGFDTSLASSFLEGPDVNSLIKCIDGYGHHNFSSVDEYEKYVGRLNHQSKYFGEVWPNNGGPALCRLLKLNLPASGRFKGTLPPSANMTSNPLLFISNTIDPVSPIIGAYKMARGFPGSAVLVQQGVGHTAIAQGGSDCMFQHIQAYFGKNATLAPANTTCTMQLVPFRDRPLFKIG